MAISSRCLRLRLSVVSPHKAQILTLRQRLRPVFVSQSKFSLPPMTSSPRTLTLSHGLEVQVHADRAAAGKAAARHVHALLQSLLAAQRSVRVMFACAPSQDVFLETLAQLPLPWERITAFHMDEYCGLGADHPASFRNYLQRHLLSKIRPGAFHGICGEAAEAEKECARYAALLREAPLDLICFGIGENGHLAFNDPPVADFEDAAEVKRVELDLACREQQVHDRCFETLEAVPTHALTVTLPVFLQATHVSGVVTGVRKSAAVAASCEGPVGTRCPASLLQKRAGFLFIDSEAGAGLAAGGLRVRP